jgi:hypothetical protein
MASQVFSDMDGVLADFNRGYEQVTGTPIRGWVKITPHDWKRLQREWPTFWMDLDHMPYAMELWRLLSRYNASLLTAIPDGWPSAGMGKAVWAKQNLPKFGYHPSQRLLAVHRSEKKDYARQPDGTPNILIDDLDKNISEWEAAGGIGIHYIPSGSMIKKIERILQQHATN